jgi:hypothetical protein
MIHASSVITAKSGSQTDGRDFMARRPTARRPTARRNVSFQAAFLASSILAWPAMAADVTPDRLVNADKEPQN